MVKLGVMFRRETAPEHVGDFARRAESAGFDEVWVVEDCFYAGGIAQAATALAHTSRIQVGLGIMPAVARNAAFTALEIASLARIAPRRFLPGLGHGVTGWMQQIGALPKSQLRALEEHTTAVRAILRGETVTVQGEYVQLDKVLLEFPLDDVPPIQLGVRGPKSLHLSGRVADGTILAEGCSPAYVRWARQQIDIGRAQANRTDNHNIMVYIYWSMDTDHDSAIKRVRDRIAARLLAGKMDIYLQPMGVTEQAAELVNANDETTLAAHIPDEWVHQLAVAGTAEQCAETINQLAAAGVDSVCLVPLMDNDSALSVYAEALLGQF